MRLWPRWTALQWCGSLMMLVGCVSAGILMGPQILESHAIPSVPLDQLGLATDHAVKAQAVAAAMPKFRLVGAAAAEDNTHKNVRLWDAVLQVRGSHLPNVPQQIGDCVSWGAANAVNYLQFVQLVRGPPAEFQAAEFHSAYPPWIYGASRVWVGSKHGSRFRGDGSVGAYAAEALSTYGCLRADHDRVPPYSGAVAREWGAHGPPEWAKEIAKPYLVQTVSPVNSAAEARDAIAGAQCPVTIASGWWGTTDIPVVNGRRVARRTTSWGHQQCLIAYDGSGPGEPLFYCLNSWGPNAHPAPLQGEPPGGYWIKFSDVDRICNEGDSWAFSAFEGFPAAGPNWDDLLRRPATSSAPVLHQDGGGEIMFVGLVACALIAVGGLVLFRMVRPRTMIAAAGLIACGIGSAVPAQDFAVAAKRSSFQVTGQATGQAPGQALGQATGQPAPVDTASAAIVARSDVQSATEPIWQHAVSRGPEITWVAAQERPATTAHIGKPQALFFVTSIGCGACRRGKAYLQTTVAEAGWTASEAEDADFRIVDIYERPDLARQYGVELVPTAIYLTSSGQVAERREGFDLSRNWTTTLRNLR